MHRRDGTHPNPEHPSHDRYRLAHEHYERIADPVHAATLIVDTTDWRAPRQVFADRC